MQEKEIHLRDYIRVIRKRRNLVLSVFIIVFTLSVIAAFTSSRVPLYRSTTRILVEKSDPNPLVESSVYAYRSWDPEFLETQANIITGSSVALRVVKSLALDTTYKLFFLAESEKPSAVSIWFKGVVNGRDHDEKAVTDALPEALRKKRVGPSDAEVIAEMIIRNTELTPVKDTRIIEIAYTSKNPVIAQMVAEGLVKAYNDELLDMRMKSASYAVDWMSKKADEERHRLEQTERALSDYMREKDIVTIEDKIAIVPEKMAALSSQLTQAETKRKQLEAVTNALKNLKPGEAETIPEISGNKVLQDLRQDIIRAEQTVIEYSRKFGRKHPSMIKAQNALEGLEESRAKEVKRLIQEITNDYELAKTHEKDLNQLLAQAKNEANNLNDKYIQYKILKRDAESNRNLYGALESKIKEQAMAEKIQTVNVWTVQAAKVPDQPVSTHKKRKLALGLILGLLFGIGLAFFVDYLDNTIKSADEAEQRLGVPVLGVISFLRSKKKNVEHMVALEPLSELSENYKAIRTAVLLSSADHPPACLLVTSMSPREGKTTTVSNIASAMAQIGKKVLILDADLRRPRTHSVYGVPNTLGLSTYLAGDTELSITTVPAMSLLTAGPTPPDPSELLSSRRFTSLIDRLRVDYDIIILDSPPLFSVSDALILSNVADGVLLVARAGKTTYDIAKKGVKQLRDLRIHVTGLVINGADERKGTYDYYGRYGYYGYGNADLK